MGGKHRCAEDGEQWRRRGGRPGPDAPARYTATMPSRALWLWLFVASLGVTAVLGMMALLLPDIPYEQELLGTSALLTGYSLAGLIATVAIARGRMPWLPWTAVALLMLSFGLWLALTWFHAPLPPTTEETFVKAAGTLTTFGILPLHASLLLLVPFHRHFSRVVRAVTIAAACTTATLITIAIWEIDLFPRGEYLARLMGAFSIPTALGTIAVPVLARIEFLTRREGEEHVIARHVPVWRRCPRCGHEGEQDANRRGLCPACGLAMTITLAEPRCPCGYLLYGLREPICPECGRAIDKSDWWRPPGHDPA